jgi:hypothetical protein
MVNVIIIISPQLFLSQFKMKNIPIIGFQIWTSFFFIFTTFVKSFPNIQFSNIASNKLGLVHSPNQISLLHRICGLQFQTRKSQLASSSSPLSHFRPFHSALIFLDRRQFHSISIRPGNYHSFGGGQPRGKIGRREAQNH